MYCGTGCPRAFHLVLCACNINKQLSAMSIIVPSSMLGVFHIHTNPILQTTKIGMVAIHCLQWDGKLHITIQLH